MTLKEKLCEPFDGLKLKRANKLEQIADDYAIEFSQWLRFNAIETTEGWQFDGKYYTDTTILEIFKKENGL